MECASYLNQLCGKYINDEYSIIAIVFDSITLIGRVVWAGNHAHFWIATMDRLLWQHMGAVMFEVKCNTT